MNVAAKITSLTTANSISIGENVYHLLGSYATIRISRVENIYPQLEIYQS